MTTYVIIGIVCFVVGFIVASLFKDNIVIGFGNKVETEIKHWDDLDDAKPNKSSTHKDK